METGFKSYHKNDILIFEIKGFLDETNADQLFEKIYNDIGDFTENTKIIFQLAGLTYLNSKSIGYIADIIEQVTENQGRIYFSNCEKGVQDTLDLVGITKMVPIVDDYKEAIEEINS